MNKMKDPVELKNHKLSLALRGYKAATKRIPRDIDAYWKAFEIAEEWLLGNDGRTASADTSAPVYLRLGLGKHDDLCVEAMLFLEEMEEEYGKAEQSTIYSGDSDSLVAFNLPEVAIYFTVGESTHCKIIKEKETKVIEETTGRKVVCW